MPRDEVLRALAEVSPIPLLISRQSDGEILYCNEKTGALVGLPARELVGRHTLDFYDAAAERASIFAELWENGRVRDRELRLTTSSGETVWVVCNIEPWHIGAEPLALIALTDVTRRKEVERRLQESEARFRGFVENASELVFAVDRNASFTYVSPNATRLLGYAPAELLGQSFDALVHADDLPRLWQCAELTQQTGVVQPSCEFRLEHQDGSERWFCSTLAPSKNEQGAVVGLTGTAHDITQEKQAILELEGVNQHLRDAQLQLLEREKMASLGMLLAGIAHEVRTPLSAVGSTQQTLAQALDKLTRELREAHPEVFSDSRVARLLKVLGDSARVVGAGSTRVTEIVQRLRRFACSEQTKLSAVDVNAIAEETLALVQHELRHEVSIRRNFGAGVTLMGYPGRLNQVLVNLLVNAAHAVRARGSGTITLETRALSDEIEIEIKDDGIGVSPEHLEQIFVCGFTTKHHEEGSGLGLAISKAIINEHHGSIQVRSQVGIGTTFTIRLPRCQPERRSARPCPFG
ncbi:MAG: PAS domain S-box protein [Deltaproteobacteria bacterium]